ncbi:MAG: TetR/AcrR family transcriptional regulator [Actinomycetes bacterium]
MASQRHIAFERPAVARDPLERDLVEHDPILVAAHASIMDLGLRRTTVAEVARRAGLSRMTVYRQYGDLASVVGALLSAETGRLGAEVRTAAARLPTARERAVECTVRVVAGLAHHPLLRRVLDLDPESLLPYVTDRLGSSQRALVAVLEDEIADGVRDGSIRDVDPHRAALTLLLAAQSFVFSARVVAAEDDEDEVLDELRHLADGYLRR